MQTYSQSETDILFARTCELKQQGINPYPRNFIRTHTLCDINESYEGVGNDYEHKQVALSSCGRVMDMHSVDGQVFIMIEDQDSELQLLFDPMRITSESLAIFQSKVYRGDYLGFEIDLIYRKQEHITGRVIQWRFLALCMLPLPRQIMSIDKAYRQRHINLASNFETRQRLMGYSKVLSFLRRLLEDQYHCLEVSMPNLANDNNVSTTNHYLQRLLIGGIERVYSIAPASNIQATDWHTHHETQMMQCCIFLADLDTMMKLTEELFVEIAKQLQSTRIIVWKHWEQIDAIAQSRRLLQTDPDNLIEESFSADDMMVDLVPPWSRRSVYELVRDLISVDFAQVHDVQTAIQAARQANIEIPDPSTFTSIKAVLIEIIDQVVAPLLIQPTFIIGFPANDAVVGKSDKRSTPNDQFQLYINGLKFAEGYIGMTDPLEYQAHAYVPEDAFLNALKYGLPPYAGLSIDIDRLAMLMTGAVDIRDVIYFPVP